MVVSQLGPVGRRAGTADPVGRRETAAIEVRIRHEGAEPAIDAQHGQPYPAQRLVLATDQAQGRGMWPGHAVHASDAPVECHPQRFGQAAVIQAFLRLRRVLQVLLDCQHDGEQADVAPDRDPFPPRVERLQEGERG